MKINKLMLCASVLGVVFTDLYGQTGESIYRSETFSIDSNKVIQGNNQSQIISPTEIRSYYETSYSPSAKPTWVWKQTKDLTAYPQFSSDCLITNAMYNLSLEEMTNLMEQDGTWRTGAGWGGVWTRDVSYSILLAMSYMNPQISQTSLMRKVRNGKIVQDTGTGGSWPVSSDRIVWTLGAWQVYLVTGEKAWLEQVYPIIKNSLLQDEQTVYDPQTGLVRGESSFLDWREEEYPRWMQPVDIFESECLGTNALFYQANVIAARMAGVLGDKASQEHFEQQAGQIKESINQHLWIEEKGYYGQYLYGRTEKIVSPRSETLGEALCVLFGIADQERAQRVISSVAQTPFGTPCFFPQISNIYPYHNNAVWPFVQAYWMWASALSGNEEAVAESIAAIYRAAAMFATNQENFIATNGDYRTDTNSRNMLWSIAGNLSIVHRIFCGITFEQNGLSFRPFIPECFQGNKRLKNFSYRKANLDIEVIGYGDQIEAFYLDGKGCPAFVPARMKGKHQIKIVMNNRFATAPKVHHSPVLFSVETPMTYIFRDTELAWRKVPDTRSYKILKDGQLLKQVDDRAINQNSCRIEKAGMYTEYQVIAVGHNGCESFASEPLSYYDADYENCIDMTRFAAPTHFEKCKRYTGAGAVEITVEKNNKIEMEIPVEADGEYVIDFRYANGNSTLIESNQCANRTLWVDGKRIGIMVFPQRGGDLWDNWGYSNAMAVKLTKGVHHLVLSYEDCNQNMNEDNINRAMLDYIRLIRKK